MDRNALPPAEPNRRPRGLLFALVLSLILHALFALILWTVPAARLRATDDAPLADVPVVVVPVEEFTVSLAGESSPHPAKINPPEPVAEPAGAPIKVRPLPLNTDDPTSEEVERLRVDSSRAGGNPAGTAADSAASSGDGLTFFGMPVPARSVVFVIDRSTSMGLYGGLQAAKRELLANLERLPATTRYQALFYNRDVEAVHSPERDGLLPNTDETRQQVIQLANRVRAAGGTDHVTPLRQALALRPEAILLITDADDLKPEHVRSITELNNGRSAIHTVQWSLSPSDNEPLKALAQLNRGMHRKIDHRYHARNE